MSVALATRKGCWCRVFVIGGRKETAWVPWFSRAASSCHGKWKKVLMRGRGLSQRRGRAAPISKSYSASRATSYHSVARVHLVRHNNKLAIARRSWKLSSFSMEPGVGSWTEQTTKITQLADFHTFTAYFYLDFCPPPLKAA